MATAEMSGAFLAPRRDVFLAEASFSGGKRIAKFTAAEKAAAGGEIRRRRHISPYGRKLFYGTAYFGDCGKQCLRIRMNRKGDDV